MHGDRVVWLAALAVVVARFPSALWPLRPDEAGFLLVARSWQPEAASLYGPHFVDRPPQIIALVELSDWIGGPYFLRLVGALGLGLLVLAGAGAAREVAHWAGVAQPAAVRRAARWTALVTAALAANAEVDPISVKGEHLGIPLVVLACWLALRATRLESWRLAFLGGLAASLAMGMKQNIVGGLVFGGIVLIGSLVTRRLSGRSFGALALAATVGAAVPVVVTVAWTLAAGVSLETLWHTVVTFRFDANDVLERQKNTGPQSRKSLLLTVFIGTGMALLVVWFVARLPRVWRALPVVTVATAVMLAVDGAGVLLSGSYWLPYLILPIPGIVLGFAAVMVTDEATDGRPGVARLTRMVAGVAVVSSVLSLIGFVGIWIRGITPTEVRTGRAIAEASKPGDTLLVYGGRADLQWASGLRSPYTHLWSLPMRTLDTGLTDLRALLTGPEAPTWVVTVVQLDAWTELGTAPIQASLLTRYDLVTVACDKYRVYHLNTVDEPTLDVDCKEPWRRTVLGWDDQR